MPSSFIIDSFSFCPLISSAYSAALITTSRPPGQLCVCVVFYVILGDHLKFCFHCQKQAESQVPKKKKKTKKAKGDDNDSGVEVYFREEEDQEGEQEPKPDAAKVSRYSAALYGRCSDIFI